MSLRRRKPQRINSTAAYAVQYLQSIERLLIRKANAYGGSIGSDLVKQLAGVDPERGILVRFADKVARLSYSINHRNGKDTEDTIGDMIGYLALLRGFQLEKEKARKCASRRKRK